MAYPGYPVQRLYAHRIANLGHHKLLLHFSGAICRNAAYNRAGNANLVGVDACAVVARYDVVRLDSGAQSDRYTVDPGADGNAAFRSIYPGDCVLLASSISFYAQ